MVSLHTRMDVLPLHFNTLRYCGVWYETKQHWFVKYIWRAFTVTSIFLFTISQLGALTVYRDNVNDFTECLFLSLTYFGLCFKLINLLCRHDSMRDLLKEFRMDICRAKNDREIEILKRYKRIVAMIYHLHIGVAQLNGVSFAIIPLVALAVGSNDTILPYKTYEIYDKTNCTYYWLTYVFQIVSACISIFVNVTLDTILAGFLLITCGQIDLCCHRFITSSSDQIKRSTRACIVHHTLIWRIIRKLENFFMCVVLPLMFMSLITFCTSVYNVSQTENSGAEWISFFIYLVCLLCQLGIYCWFGNELKLKSYAISDSIYESDWTTLRPVDRKNLYFIMLSCQKEMSISFHGFCTITIDIFVWVLKTSYGAYNLLKTVE